MVFPLRDEEGKITDEVVEGINDYSGEKGDHELLDPIDQPKIEGFLVAVFLDGQLPDDLGVQVVLLGVHKSLAVEVEAVEKKRLFQIVDGTDLRQTEEEIKVFSVNDRLVVPDEILRQERSIDHHSGVLHGVNQKDHGPDALVGDGEAFVANKVVVLVDGVTIAADDNGARVSAEVAKLNLQPVLHGDVITVHTGDILSPGELHASVEGVDDVSVSGVAEDSEALIGLC